MTQQDGNGERDEQVEQILAALSRYQDAHPNAQMDVRRRNPVSIRIRIIDPDFQGMDRVDREPELWRILEQLPEEIFANVTMLLLLTPEEAKQSFANYEFENPIPSPL